MGNIQNSTDGKIKIKRDLGQNYCRRPDLRERWKARETLCEEQKKNGGEDKTGLVLPVLHG